MGGVCGLVVVGWVVLAGRSLFCVLGLLILFGGG